MQANRLADSSSPYLLQHAHNPVDWFPWGEEALTKAKREDKPIIVSVGYAACHWCHVMAHESFEDEEIASIMNEHFVCIKIDREERPDIDAIYMDAVQAMGQRGGWPLNAFLTPDAKPFYAGTYFPPEHWAKLLLQIAQIFKDKRSELEQSADEFRNTIAQSDVEKYKLFELSQVAIQKPMIGEMYRKLSEDFDLVHGGIKKAPKFPMPSIYTFLLNYYFLSKDPKALQHIDFSLTCIAQGGIYDHVAGGFARYSVDDRWLVPHFEKMLYDNAQLITLYSQAFSLTKNPLYKQVVYETIEFVKTELTSPEGAFYASLDADSEGIEGKYYVWTFEELKAVITQDWDLFVAYYQCSPEGNFEHQNILNAQRDILAFCESNQISLADFNKKNLQWKKELYQVRNKRIKAMLDDKILTSWNGLMLQALAEAYRVFGEENFLKMAVTNIDFIQKNLLKNGRLFRTYKNGEANIQAFLEDYAIVVEALISLYQANFNLEYLLLAKDLADLVISNFYDEKENLFFFTDKEAEALIARKKELFDNVIPASNSIMAKNLFLLGLYFDEKKYTQISEDMMARVQKLLLQNVEYFGNWATLAAWMCQDMAEVVIVGKDYQFLGRALDAFYYPSKILIGVSQSSQDLPFLIGKDTRPEDTTVYVCFNKTCQLPVSSIEEAIEQLRK